MRLVERLKKKFISHNSVPISSIRISREEFDEIGQLIEGYKELIERHNSLLNISLEHKRTLMKSCEQALSERDGRIGQMASAIHYPDCWDTVSFPTLLDAVKELGRNASDCLLIQDTQG